MVACNAHADGFYLGANANYMQGTFDHTIALRNPPGPNQSIKDGTQGFGYGIEGGYRWYFNHYTLASSLYYFDDNLVYKNVGSTTTNTNKLSYDYGLKIMPGYLIQPGFIFQGILGGAMGQFKYQAIGANNYTNNYSEPGYILGAGIDYQLCKNLHLNSSYEYTYFRNKENISGDTGYYQRNGNEFTKRLLVGVSYHF
jgi:opacity protein-like surface antigen